MDDGVSVDLVAWLREQLDEDERVAQSIDPHDWLNADWAEVDSDLAYLAQTFTFPARVLREVAAKRAIVERVAEDAAIADNPLRAQAASTAEWWLVTQARDVLRLLASAYADRPGYRSEWAPAEESQRG